MFTHCSDASSVSDSATHDGEFDEWEAFAIEEIPSMADEAIEAAIKWLSVPRPVQHLDSRGLPIECCMVLANDVTGNRIVGSSAMAAGYRAKQLDDMVTENGEEFTYTAAQRDGRASSASVRPVLQFRDGTGVVPLAQTPTTRLYLQDIEFLSRYDGPVTKPVLPAPAAAGSRLAPSIPTGLVSRQETSARASSPPRSSALSASQPSVPDAAPWAVSIQLKKGKRSLLSGRGRTTVALAFDKLSESDAKMFRTHIQVSFIMKYLSWFLHQHVADVRYFANLTLTLTDNY